MNSATTDRPNWWVRRGPATGWWVGGAHISWHTMSHSWKIDTTAVERKGTLRELRKNGRRESPACGLGTDTCASNYLKSSPNAFCNYTVSCWGGHKINHKPMCLPRKWLQHLLSCRSKITAISCICGWWQLTTADVPCPVSLNFNFTLLQSMSAAVFHHSLNPLAICPLAPVVFLSTILICLASHFSTCTALHCK